MSVLWYESFVEQLFGAMGAEYEIINGVAKGPCNTDYPDIYFLVDGYWLQLTESDYLRNNLGDGSSFCEFVPDDPSCQNVVSGCSLKIKPIDAPFNIFGMPAFLGYYVGHNWEQGTMSFAPHKDSSKSAVKAATVFPTQELRIKYESENTANGDVWAFAISFFIALLCVAFYGYVVYITYQEGTTFSGAAEAAGFAFAGFVAIFIGFFILQWLLLLFFMPGNVVQPVPEAGEAAARISSTHMSALGFLAVFFYKLKSKMTKKQVKAEEKQTPSMEVDELINTIE